MSKLWQKIIFNHDFIDNFPEIQSIKIINCRNLANLNYIFEKGEDNVYHKCIVALLEESNFYVELYFQK